MVLSLTELGKRLEEARKQKKITLDELQTITKIQKRYLQAIEDGNYDILPGKFYARAFIKQYAEAVGIDPEKLFEEYATEVPKTETEVSSGLSRVKNKQTSVSNTSSLFFSLLPKILVVVLVISVFVFIWLFWQKQDLTDKDGGDTSGPVVESQEDENVTIVNPNDAKEVPEVPDETQQSEETPQDIVDTPGVPEQEVPEAESVQQQLVQVAQKNGNSPTTTYELKGTEQFTVELTSTGRSYVGIKNGMGKSFYGAELKEGEKVSYDFSAEQEIELNIGRTLDVVVKINGQDFTYPFPPNEKVHQKIKITFNKAT